QPVSVSSSSSRGARLNRVTPSSSPSPSSALGKLSMFSKNHLEKIVAAMSHLSWVAQHLVAAQHVVVLALRIAAEHEEDIRSEADDVTCLVLPAHHNSSQVPW